MKIKTSELTGKALDWAVRSADYAGFLPATASTESSEDDWEKLQKGCDVSAHVTHGHTALAKYWAHCGGCLGLGDTAREAVCRALVQYRLGDEVEVPDEFAEGV